MNTNHIDEFKRKTNDLASLLNTFLQMSEQMESHDADYEAKMKDIASQNKIIEDKNSALITKEQEVKESALSMAKLESENNKLNAELLLGKQILLKDKQNLVINQTSFDKEKEDFEKTRTNEELLRTIKRQLDQRKTELDSKEALLLEKEKLNDERAQKLTDREKIIRSRELYLQGLV